MSSPEPLARGPWCGDRRESPRGFLQPQPLCDIVVPIWNQIERTKRCLESVLRCTDLPVRLILIDNGSETPTREGLETFAFQSPVPAQIIRNSNNLGFIKAVNQGIRTARSPWICLLNNDTIVTSDWLTEMIRIADSDPRIGLVNPTSNSLGFAAGKKGLHEYAREIQAESGRWSELTTALGFCLLARRTLLDRVGGLDEAFGMGNFDDDDLSRRVRQTGLLCVRACGAYVYHEEKVSFRELPGWQEDFKKNRCRFQERWGRSLRILYDLASIRSSDRPARLETAAQLAREGHWVTLLLPRGPTPNPELSQAQIARVEVNPRFWRIQAAWRLLSKRKKPMDVVISTDPIWCRWVTRLKPFHRARILPNGSTEGILTECRNLSRSRSLS